MSTFDITFQSEDSSNVFQLEVSTNDTLAELLKKFQKEVLIPLQFIDIVDDSGSPLPLDMQNALVMAVGLHGGMILTYIDRRFLPLSQQERNLLNTFDGQFRVEYVNFAYTRPALFKLLIQRFPAFLNDLHEDLKTRINGSDRDLVQFLEENHYKIDIGHRKAYYTHQRDKNPANAAKWESLLEDLDYEEQIEHAYRYAMEHTPEAFVPVYMLYVNLEVNGEKLKAFVDSGAQTTIMSEDCAKRCGLMKLIDRRYKGTALGVGSSTILGRIHSAKVKLGSSFIMCSFSVIENLNTDLLLGLDQLKRHQMVIDMAADALIVHGEKINFLREHEIPENAARTPLVSPGPAPSIASPRPHAGLPMSPSAAGAASALRSLGLEPNPTVTAPAASSQSSSSSAPVRGSFAAAAEQAELLVAVRHGKADILAAFDRAKQIIAERRRQQ